MIIFLIITAGIVATLVALMGLVGILVCMGSSKANRERLDRVLAQEASEWAESWSEPSTTSLVRS